MGKLLFAVSAIALSVGLVATAEAAGPKDADVNVVNIAVNVVPAHIPGFGSVDPVTAIDGSINVSATLGGSVGHQGWHGDLNLGKTETFAVGAVNQANTYVGRDQVSGAFSMERNASRSTVNHRMGHFNHAGHLTDGDGEAVDVDAAHSYEANGSDYWARNRASSFTMNESFAADLVPETNVLNAALNTEMINGSANYSAHFGGSIDNIGAVSTTAIGALNVSTTVIGVPGNLGDLGVGGVGDVDG